MKRLRMNTKLMVLLSFLSCVAIAIPVYSGFGGRGGGGRGGGGRPGGGGMSRPSSRPNISAPNISRPSSRPNVSRPSAPSRPSSRPSIPSRPNISPPSGGFKPSIPNRPSGGTRPSLPSGQKPSFPSGNRPSTSLPNMPSFPSGGTRPQTRPGNRPGGENRPSLPNAGNRPSLPGGNNRPSLPGGGNRPEGRPSFPGGRPQPGDLGDFLGIDKPLRPETQPGLRPETRPGTRPGNGSGNRPGFNPDNRPSNLPATRPGGNRPGWIDGSGSHNNIINNKPGWINIDNSTNINIHNRWTNAINNQGNRVTTLPAERRRYWNNWGGGVRHHWDYGRYHNCFNDRWWSTHYHGIAGWHYCYHYNRYHWSYWWQRPAWARFGTWFVWWNANASSWQQPVYYDYGSGGNVYYEGDTVYLAGEPISSTEDFAMSAGKLATVAPPATEEEAESAEWMPLGTFALSTGENDIDPSRVVQLAVDRQGVISGTLYNTQSDQTQTIQGQVDKQTQRVAFRMGDNENLVAETGLYNLTQDEVPLLVHFGTEQTETYLLVRLEEPAEGEDQ